jgi:RNA polymerase sigma-70 factor (ECF subfamily)
MTLDDDIREVIVLRYIEGYSIKETALLLKRTEDSVKSTAKRALKSLRKSLDPMQQGRDNIEEVNYEIN